LDPTGLDDDDDEVPLFGEEETGGIQVQVDKGMYLLAQFKLLISIDIRGWCNRDGHIAHPQVIPSGKVAGGATGVRNWGNWTCKVDYIVARLVSPVMKIETRDDACGCHIPGEYAVASGDYEFDVKVSCTHRRRGNHFWFHKFGPFPYDLELGPCCADWTPVGRVQHGIE
jgi:hypothetical protein